MTITQTAPASTAVGVDVTGTVRSPLMLVRTSPGRVPHVSFRIDGVDGPYNVHARGVLAELLRQTIRKGNAVRVHAPCATLAHPDQHVPDLEADSVELDLR